MLPTILPYKQKEARKNVRSDTLDVIENDRNLSKRIITCGESWFLLMILKRRPNPCTGRAHLHRYCFPDIYGIVYLHWFLKGQLLISITTFPFWLNSVKE
ncbi:hypothetical protein TNCV_493811 [Trichonephila clavipes]|nr:hypothetical protein TNCV_493811 [Trichonephila clavipes]